ncbi:MAG: hypothetical protein E5X76_18235 [Mesorhizobium sp.]|nr:MAG: hypothetical protein E5X76_18235 [Mesorhizobium sp.]
MTTSARRSWGSRLIALLALVASITASVAAFLTNVGNIRGALVSEYNPPEIMVRDIDQHTDGNEFFDTHDSVLRYFPVLLDAVVEKKGPGSAKNCKGQIISKEPYHSATIDSVRSTGAYLKGDDGEKFVPFFFELPDNVNSIQIDFEFWLDYFQKAPPGFNFDFRVVCDGTISKPLPVPSMFMPATEPAS